MNVNTTDVPSGTAVSSTASPDAAASAVVSLPIVITAVAIVVGLGIIALIVNRLRKLDPVAFRRAISNGGAFQGVLLLAHLADVGLDVAACVTVIADPTTSTNIAALFGVLTAIALTVSAIEVTVDVRTMWRLTRNKLDIDGAAELQRQVSAAEALTLLAEDLPMLLIAGSLEFAATRSSEPMDPTTSTYLLLVVVFSAVMIGMKLNNVRPLLNRLLADRTYEENCAEMAQLTNDDLRTLESVLCDYDIFETIQRRRWSTADDDVSDKSRSIILAASTINRTNDADDIEDLLRMSTQELSVGAFDLQRRIFRLLRDLSRRPLDMDSPQSHLDALAVVLELAYPHRYGHLERSAEATAQALTEAAVSQSEFYAVVLPYLMLLYDKEGAPSAPSERAGEVAADKADIADINTNALAGLAGTVHTSGDETKRPTSSDSDDDDADGEGTSPHTRPMQRSGFSMVRVVRMREEELERLATVQNLRPMSRATATALPRPHLQLTVHSASDDTRAPPLSPMVPPNPTSSSSQQQDRMQSRRFSAAACARLGQMSLRDLPMVASPGLKDVAAGEDGFAVSVEVPQPQSPAAPPVRPQPKSSMRKLASRTRRQLQRQIVMFTDDGLVDDDEDDDANEQHDRVPAAAVAAAAAATEAAAAHTPQPPPPDDDDHVAADGTLTTRYDHTRTFVGPSEDSTQHLAGGNDGGSGHDELSPPLAAATPSPRTLRRRQSAAYLNTRARFIHAVRLAMPHRR